jgi:nitrite reductase (NO-forming)
MKEHAMTSVHFQKPRRSAVLIGLLSLIGACNAPSVAVPEKPTVSDPYDQSKMDLAPKPSVTTQERPANPSSLPAMHVLPNTAPAGDSGGKLVEVRLDATNKVIDLAPNVKYAGWTFGNQIPAPSVRVRQGDRVRFVMTNRTDENIDGLNVSSPMMHSMDFHSAMVSPQDKYKSIAPGETLTFEFQANYPGVFMFHCGTPPIYEHIASGMYGVMIVEPRGGYPTKVDREYVLVQSEFYAKLDPQGRKIDGVPLYVFDSDAMLHKQPTHVVFNGRVNGYVEHPLVAKPGERVRLFVLNVGPNDTSSFHVVGTIFDRVWDDGIPYGGNEMRGKQTMLLGASNGVIVEFLLAEKGKYIIVDHEFTDVRLGAVGLIDATGGQTAAVAPPEPMHMHGDHAAVMPPAMDMKEQGHQLFAQRCAMCHAPPAGTPRIAPDLVGVTDRHPKEWLTRWLEDPAPVLVSDPVAQALLRQWNNVPMPDPGLDAAQIEAVIAHLGTLKAAP